MGWGNYIPTFLFYLREELTMAVEQLDDGRIVELAKIIATDIQLPTEIQSRRTQSILTQNAVALTISGGATPTSTSAYVNADGWDSLNITAKASASHTGRIQIQWSLDGTTTWNYELVSVGYGTVINSGAFQYREFSIPVRAPYFAVYYENQDAAVPVTVSVNAYLKA